MQVVCGLACGWFVAILASLPPFFDVAPYLFDANVGICTPHFSTARSLWYGITFTILTLVIPGFIIILCNIKVSICRSADELARMEIFYFQFKRIAGIYDCTISSTSHRSRHFWGDIVRPSDDYAPTKSISVAVWGHPTEAAVTQSHVKCIPNPGHIHCALLSVLHDRAVEQFDSIATQWQYSEKPRDSALRQSHRHDSHSFDGIREWHHLWLKEQGDAQNCTELLAKKEN